MTAEEIVGDLLDLTTDDVREETRMASEDLRASWKRTEAFLLDARSHLSQLAEALCADEIAEFHGYLEHNELELALDMLDVVLEMSELEELRVVELMALAAASMGETERQERYDKHLSKARGGEYQTKWSP